MRRIYLIRHASPAVQPDVPTREWLLSERGVDEARSLAVVASAWDLRAIYCGDEPKMRATALVIAEPTTVAVHVVDAFNESRLGEWVANADEFNDLVRSMFAGDDPLPRGIESANEAAERFATGLAIVGEGAFPAAIVSGGRVLTAYLSRKRRGIEDAFHFWRTIPFPGWTALDLDDPDEAVAPFR